MSVCAWQTMCFVCVCVHWSLCLPRSSRWIFGVRRVLWASPFLTMFDFSPQLSCQIALQLLLWTLPEKAYYALRPPYLSLANSFYLLLLLFWSEISILLASSRSYFCLRRRPNSTEQNKAIYILNIIKKSPVPSKGKGAISLHLQWHLFEMTGVLGFGLSLFWIWTPTVQDISPDCLPSPGAVFHLSFPWRL